jgi:arginase
MQPEIDPNKIALIGVPSSAGARQVGQEQAPQSLRAAGLVQRLQSDGHEVMDLGDLTPATFAPDTQNPKQQNLALVVGVVRQVAEAVDAAIADRAWPLIIGGDCTVTIGVVAALRRYFDGLGMTYLDGDLDLNTPATTSSGIFDGMVLAHILGEGAHELSHVGSHYPLLEEQNISLFGYSVEAGGVDPVEIELLQNRRMARHPYEEIKDEVRTAAAKALTDLESKAEHVVVHFDVDVVDVDDFPAVDVPHKPGLSLVQAREALGVFLGSSKSVGLVVTEFNAGLDSDGKYARQLADTIQSAIATV